MAEITLISGSTLGSAEYVAEHLAEKLDDGGFSSEILHGPMLEEVPTDGIWLIISSTHGAGTFLTTCSLYMMPYASRNRTCHKCTLVQSGSAVVNMTPFAAQSTSWKPN